MAASSDEGDGAYVALLAAAEEHKLAQRFSNAAKLMRKAATLKPADPRAWFHLIMVLTLSDELEEACACALRAVELAPGRHLGVLGGEARRGFTTPIASGVYPQLGLRAAVMAFDLLVRRCCDGVARPGWWNDADLLAMSERALADTPDSPVSWSTRAAVLTGAGGAWALGPRDGAQLREAAALLEREAKSSPHKAAQCLGNAERCLAVAARLDASPGLQLKAARLSPPPRAAHGASEPGAAAAGGLEDIDD